MCHRMPWKLSSSTCATSSCSLQGQKTWVCSACSHSKPLFMTAWLVGKHAAHLGDLSTIWKWSIQKLQHPWNLSTTSASIIGISMVCTTLTLAFNTCLQFGFVLARPCTADGSFLTQLISNATTPSESPNTSSGNPWAHFQDRLAFDWAHYHYVCLQSSESNILEGLDLWCAMVIKHQSAHEPFEGIPWKNVNELYSMINSIAVGGVGWKSYKFHYTGPKPAALPQWMEETYDLNVRDVLTILEHQISSTQFNGQFDYVPYQEYDSTGNCVYSNLMSAFWENREVVCSSRIYPICYLLTNNFRTPLQKIHWLMGLCSSP